VISNSAYYTKIYIFLKEIYSAFKKAYKSLYKLGIPATIQYQETQRKTKETLHSIRVFTSWGYQLPFSTKKHSAKQKKRSTLLNHRNGHQMNTTSELASGYFLLVQSSRQRTAFKKFALVSLCMEIFQWPSCSYSSRSPMPNLQRRR
jgi:hypothetical protein